jgi:hypothetical protein
MQLANVHKGVFATAIARDETEDTFGAEKLDRSCQRYV